jgi:chorismate mutase
MALMGFVTTFEIVSLFSSVDRVVPAAPIRSLKKWGYVMCLFCLQPRIHNSLKVTREQTPMMRVFFFVFLFP